MIYPRRCPICGNIVVPRNRLVCESCKLKVVRIKEPRCKCCSKPVDTEEQEFCYDCSHKKFAFEYGYSMWIYDATMKRSIGWFKYNRRKEYADFYVTELAKWYGKRILGMRPDALIPVPVHRSREHQRGFNQADIIARKLGKALNIPIYTDILIRTRKTLPQKELSNTDRLKNIQHAFEVKEDTLKKATSLRCVILIDDIYTTGSTLDACARVLKKVGVNEIYFITLCIGQGF